MKTGEKMRRDALRRYIVYRMKLIELIHFNLLWKAVRNGGVVPTNLMGHDAGEFAQSIRVVVLSWFCTIVDQSSGGLNVFDLWRELFPKHRKEIDAVWNEIEPHWEVLRDFRDKCGFHADKPRAYLLAQGRVLKAKGLTEAVQRFLALAASLLKKEEEELTDFVPEMETFLLDFELEFGVKVHRDRFKRLGLLPRVRHKEVFG